MSAWRIVGLYVVVRIFGLVDAITVNSVPASVEFFSHLIHVIGIRKNVEPLDNDSARQMKTNVIYDDSLVCLRAYRERVRGIVAVNADCVGRRPLRDSLKRIAGFELIGHRQGQTEPTPLTFASTLSVVAVLRNDSIAASDVTQSNTPGFERMCVVAITPRVVAIE